MTQPPIALGFVALARPTFDVPLATDSAAAARASLIRAGYRLAGPAGLVCDELDVQQAMGALRAEPLDALLVFQATFADSTLIQALAEAVTAPVVLWAVPEERTGGRLRLNALCGINLAAHALRRAGIPYHTVYAAADDPDVAPAIRPVAQAGRARRQLRSARIGRVGEHPAGFETCRPNPSALKQRLGLDVVPVDLHTTFEAARVVDPAAVNDVRRDLSAQVEGLDTVDQRALHGTLGAYLTLRQFRTAERLDALAVRCWPEFFTDLGCAACGALSLLTDELTPCSCEADVNGAVTQLLLQAISGEPAFDADLVSVDAADDTAVLWHCGKAPLSMADPETVPRAGIHSNRRLPLLMEFPLKPGRVTLARLSEATGCLRLVIGGGEMLRAPASYSGTSGVIRFDRPAAAVLETILAEGLEHHIALTYGDHVAALEALARMLDVPALRLC